VGGFFGEASSSSGVSVDEEEGKRSIIIRLHKNILFFRGLILRQIRSERENGENIFSDAAFFTNSPSLLIEMKIKKSRHKQMCVCAEKGKNKSIKFVWLFFQVSLIVCVRPFSTILQTKKLEKRE
jgi:hypothetical protein